MNYCSSRHRPTERRKDFPLPTDMCGDGSMTPYGACTPPSSPGPHHQYCPTARAGTFDLLLREYVDHAPFDEQNVSVTASAHVPRPPPSLCGADMRY
jgi:hypothetical protein